MLLTRTYYHKYRMMLGAAMAVQENGTSVFDYFAMLRGWEMKVMN